MSDKQAVALMGYEKCQRLLDNADFQWFLEAAVIKSRQEREADLKSTATNKDDREIAAHVRDALEQVETFLSRQRDIFGRSLPTPEN